MNVTCTFTLITCQRCGIDYYVTEGLVEVRISSGDDIYCPNGHCCHLEKPAESTNISKLQAENARLKRDLFQAIHDREQAEAREMSPATPLQPGEPEALPTCSKCGKRFKVFGGVFRKHLMHEHGLDHDAADALMHETQIAFVAEAKRVKAR